MQDLRRQANQVAGAGRYGDSMLVHMNPVEVQGLARLLPMTQNPQTGQPEMFLPFLAPLLGSVAGTTLLAGTFSPAVAGAIGSGLSTAIAEGDLKKGIMAGITGFGIGNVLGQVGAGTKGAVDQATTEAIKQVAAQEGSAAALNPLVTQTLADEAGKAAAETTMAAFRSGLPVEGVQEAIASGLTTPADVLANTQGISGAGNRLSAIGENLFSGDTLSALAQPASYIPIAIGEGSRGVMEAQEQFEEDMRKFAEEQEERKKRIYAENPEQIPFSSPYYGAAQGGVIPFEEGGLASLPVTLLPTPVIHEERIVPPPPPPPPTVDTSSFESAMQGDLDFMYTPPPIAPSRDVGKGVEIQVENPITGEMQGTGQFRPLSSYRPGIDAEFNYFPYSNRPASFIPSNYYNTGYFGGSPLGNILGNINLPRGFQIDTGLSPNFYNRFIDYNEGDFDVPLRESFTDSPFYNPNFLNFTEVDYSIPDYTNDFTYPNEVSMRNPLEGLQVPNFEEDVFTRPLSKPQDTILLSQDTLPPINTINQTDIEDLGITSQAKQEALDALQNAYYSNPYLSNPYLGTKEYKKAMTENLLGASADLLENIKGTRAIAAGGDRMASGKKIDDMTRGMAIHEMEEGRTIPEDAIGLQELAKEKPDVVRTMGYEINMQFGGMTVMPEDLDMVQKAILGQIPNNQEVISMFIDKYGNEIFMQVREMVLNPSGQAQTQGMIEGMGGGMDDEVMGMIGTQQPVAVSPGEYIIPADVVSGLGDGSSDAGAKELDGLLDRVREERTNTTKQPKELNKGKVLPA